MTLNLCNNCSKVDPVFLDAENAAGDLKVAFNMKFALTCSSPNSNSVSNSWVKHPDHLDLMYVSRHFLVAVDPTGLPPGVHSAYVRAYDVTEPNKVCLFIDELRRYSLPRPFHTRFSY